MKVGQYVYAARAAFLATVLCLFSANLFAQTTTFTYQGRLTDRTLPANGTYNFAFRLFGVASGGTQISPDIERFGVPVTNGIFTVDLDFGPVYFASGNARYLEVAVTNGGPFIPLAPRQAITSAPYSIRSMNAGTADSLSAACVYCISSAQISGVEGGRITGTVILPVNGLQVGTNQLATSGGNVGIGTELPSAKLHVVAPAGNSAVILPNDAIGRAEIFDEPGVASIKSSSAVTLDGTVQTLLTRDITVPTAGFVLAIGTVEAVITHSTGTASNAQFGVSETTGFPLNQDLDLNLPVGAPSGTYQFPVTVHGLFSVTAGANTINFLGQKTVTSPNVSVNDLQLTLLFVPTAYGIIAPTLAGAEPASTSKDVSVISKVRIPQTSVEPQSAKTQQDQIDRLQRELKDQVEKSRTVYEKVDALTKLLCAQNPQAGICKEKK
jgi:hypothetical protein